MSGFSSQGTPDNSVKPDLFETNGQNIDIFESKD